MFFLSHTLNSGIPLVMIKIATVPAFGHFSHLALLTIKGQQGWNRSLFSDVIVAGDICGAPFDISRLANNGTQYRRPGNGLPEKEIIDSPNYFRL